MRKVDPKDFWENKILQWETGRYKDTRHGSFLEKVANSASNSLRYRIEVTEKILAPHVSGKRVVELGCGSGLLARPLIEAGASSYTGYDIASAAIDLAQRAAKNDSLGDNVRFFEKNLDHLTEIEGDIFFSLGLLDWLGDSQLDHLFAIQRHADWLHAIAERRPSLSRVLHAAYVRISYGYRTGMYIPRYYDIAEIAGRSALLDKPVNVYRDPRLSFGAILTTLPLNAKS